MQTAVQVICKAGPSLRTLIADQNRKLKAYEFALVAEKTNRRNPGWMKIKSTAPGIWGALNISWDPGTGTLTCRVVNRRAGTPNGIIGRFVDFLLRHHSKRIKLIAFFRFEKMGSLTWRVGTQDIARRRWISLESYLAASIAALDAHHARIFGRCESNNGIAPFGRLVEQVMTRPPYNDARRVFWIVDNCSAHRGLKAAERLRSLLTG